MLCESNDLSRFHIVWVWLRSFVNHVPFALMTLEKHFYCIKKNKKKTKHSEKNEKNEKYKNLN